MFFRPNRSDGIYPATSSGYSGQFRVRIPPELQRQLTMAAAEQGVSLNRLASAKLAGVG